jgi:glycosyltransferase involved in cell wall biosynthesis
MKNFRKNERIAIYTASLRVGGVERFVINMSAEFARRGYSVDVVLASAEGPLLDQVHRDVRVINLKSRRVFASLPRLIRYLRSENPSALLTLQTHCNIVGILARKMVSGPPRLVVSECNAINARLGSKDRAAGHNPAHLVLSENDALTTRMYHLTKESLLLRLTPYLYPQAQKIVAMSNGVADELRDLTGLDSEKIITIYNPIVAEELLAMADAPLDHPWFAAGQPPVVLSVGRLVPQKDHATLLRAFARLRDRRPARLLILGDGTERARLQSLTEQLGLGPDVAMPGFDTNPYRFMRRCAVFVLSSAWEGLGNALVEAMACGAPVVSTDCPSGPAEILQSGKFGALVSVGDDEALALAIEQALDHPTAGEYLRSRAANFSVAASADAYLKVLLAGAA